MAQELEHTQTHTCVSVCVYMERVYVYMHRSDPELHFQAVRLIYRNSLQLTVKGFQYSSPSQTTLPLFNPLYLFCAASVLSDSGVVLKPVNILHGVGANKVPMNIWAVALIQM